LTNVGSHSSTQHFTQTFGQFTDSESDEDNSPELDNQGKNLTEKNIYNVGNDMQECTDSTRSSFYQLCKLIYECPYSVASNSQLMEIMKVDTIQLFYNSSERFVSCGVCGCVVTGKIQTHLRSHKIKPRLLVDLAEPSIERKNTIELNEWNVELANGILPIEAKEGLRIHSGFKCLTCGKISNYQKCLRSEKTHPCRSRLDEPESVKIQRLSTIPLMNSWFQVKVTSASRTSAQVEASKIYDQVNK
jgi:hypothetical protein